MTSFDDKEIKHVVVLVAMEAEGKPLIDALGLHKIDLENKIAPCVIYQGPYHDGTLSVVLNGKDKRYEIDGVGTTPASIAAFVALTYLKPDIVVNAGTAGGFQRMGAKIGDAFVSSSFAHHDRRIPLPGFLEYGKSNIPSFTCTHLVENLGYKAGVVTTSNSLDHTEMDDKIMLENNASVKDMEAASIAWVMELNNTPFFAIKVVTDIVDGDRPTEEEFLEHLSAASKSLQEKLPKVVEFVMGKRLSEL